ncbi:MAG: VOC family protein [Bacteriovorax sp.]|nr:VOC family protein [Bacteriovorax sp.]
MKFLHTMLRVKDLERSLDFFVNKLGLIETLRNDHHAGKFTLVYLATAPGAPEIELTYNWDTQEEYTYGRNFGHLAFEVDNIYDTCERLMKAGVTINRPPRDGHMAFIKSPDNQSIELLQKGSSLQPATPWNEMENIGSW